MSHIDTASKFAFLKTHPSLLYKVENWQMDFPYTYHGQQGHCIITENFANSILHDEPVLVPGEKCIKALTIGNAIILSSTLRRPVRLPLEEDVYEQTLIDWIATSRFQKPTVTRASEDISKSFGIHKTHLWS